MRTTHRAEKNPRMNPCSELQVWSPQTHKHSAPSSFANIYVDCKAEPLIPVSNWDRRALLLREQAHEIKPRPPNCSRDTATISTPPPNPCISPYIHCNLRKSGAVCVHAERRRVRDSRVKAPISTAASSVFRPHPLRGLRPRAI